MLTSQSLHAIRDHYREERIPRYTSYPTAPHFRALAAETHADWLATIDEAATASLCLRIPFCRSMCWYCGYHTTVARRDAPMSDYLSILRREIELVASKLASLLAVRKVHFGGGTPTIVRPDEFIGLMASTRSE